MKFSFIVPHYDEVITDEQFIEGMSSIAKSTYKNYEVRVYHDGPLSRPLPDLDQFGFEYSFRATKKRYNDWGHSLRDLGIREAEGEYIVHFNPDNLLYSDALSQIARLDSDIIICPVILEGTLRRGNALVRTWDKQDRVVLDGFPPIHQNIDAMQLIAKKSFWLKQGGWYDRSEQSDGKMYQAFCQKSVPLYCGYLIGVHR